MKKLWIVFIILSLMLPLGFTQAQEIGSKEDNACNEGGSMAGKCDTQWEWVCGWYLARWEANGGWSTRNNPFNDLCLSLLPPQQQQQLSATSVYTACHQVLTFNFCFSDDGTGTRDDLATLKNPDDIYSVSVAAPGPCPVWADTVVLAFVPPADLPFFLSWGFDATDLLCYQSIP